MSRIGRAYLPECSSDCSSQARLALAGASREGTPMLTVASQQDAGRVDGASGGSLIDEIVREGARAMLAAGLRAEVAAYVEAHADQLDEDGHRLVVRNGYAEPRE